MAKKTGFWSKDWFLGVLVTLFMLIASRGDLLQSLSKAQGLRHEYGTF